jgi:tetratricopeptide (TPR) repeat protein
MRLLQAGDLAGAETELRQAVQIAPRDPGYLGSLGAVLGMEHKLAESDAYLERALRLNPADSKTRRNLASNQFQLGDLAAAKENLQLLLRGNSTDETVILLLGMVDEELKDYASAAQLLSSVPDQVRRRPESIAALARAYYHIGQKEKARETLHLLLTPSVGPEGVFLGGQVAAQARDFATAEEMFESIQSTYADTAKLGYHLARAQYQANQFAECQAALERLVGTGYETGQIDNLLGWCYEGQHDFKRAVASMDKAIQKDPSKESNYLDVGRILLEAQRPKGALEAARRALEVAPNSAQAYCLEGLAETKLSQPIDAVRSYAQAVKLDPSDPKAVLGLALAQEAEGKTHDAAATFELSIRQFPQDAVLYQEYGKMLLIFRGDNPSVAEAHAVSLLSKALALDKTLAEPHYELGNLALSQGQLGQAVPQLEAAAKLSPNSAKIHYALARTYRRLGRADDANRELKIFQSLKGKGTS